MALFRAATTAEVRTCLAGILFSHLTSRPGRHLLEPHSLGAGFVLHRPPHGGPVNATQPNPPARPEQATRKPCPPCAPAPAPLLESRHRELLGVQPIHYDYHVDVRVGRPFSPGDTPEQHHTPGTILPQPRRASATVGAVDARTESDTVVIQVQDPTTGQGERPLGMGIWYRMQFTEDGVSHGPDQLARQRGPQVRMHPFQWVAGCGTMRV